MKALAPLFSKPKLSSEELSNCLAWLGQQYELTFLQDTEAELYNNALLKYGSNFPTDSIASIGLVRAAERLVQAATEIVSKIDSVMSILEAASAAHHAWRIWSSSYLAWAAAQRDVIEAIADGANPRVEYVAELLKQNENYRKSRK